MTLDNLIEELTRRQTKAMAFEREHGLEGLVTLSIDEAGAILSALKENKRLREALATVVSDSAIKGAISYFEARGDADHNGVRYIPNDELRLESELKEMLARTEAALPALQPQGGK